MKIPRVVLLVFLFAFKAYSQTNTSADYGLSISNVITDLHSALTNSLVLVRPTPHQIHQANLEHKKALPHWVISMSRLANAVCVIDTSKCPDDFKTAWKTFATSLTLSTKLSPGDKAQLLKDMVKTVVASAVPVAGISEAAATTGDLIKDSDRKAEVENARHSAIFQLKLCAASYGVTDWSR